MAIEDKLRNYLQQFGRVNNNGNLIGVFLHLKKDNSYLTEEELDELFSKTEILYYFTDSKDINDYEQDEYVFRKGYIKAKVVKLNTDLNKYIYPIYLNYNYNTRYNNYNGVYISSLENIYERNFTPTSYKDEDTPDTNRKLSAALSGIDISQLSDKSLEEEKCDTIEITSHTTQFRPTETSIKVFENISNLDEWGDTDEIQKAKISKYLRYLREATQSKLNRGTLEDKYYYKHTTEADRVFYIINTRLFDKYANWIYLCYTETRKWDNASNKIVINLSDDMYIGNEVDLLQKGIVTDRDVLDNIEPIKFYKDKANLVFDAELKDFERELTSRSFTHIIEERRDRLPAELQNQSLMDVAYRIRNSIEYAIRMSKADYNYIIPCYSIERDSIQYMLPLFTNFNEDTEVETVLIVNLLRDKYVVNTILQKEDAYDIARVLNRPTASWFK